MRYRIRPNAYTQWPSMFWELIAQARDYLHNIDHTNSQAENDRLLKLVADSVVDAGRVLTGRLYLVTDQRGVYPAQRLWVTSDTDARLAALPLMFGCQLADVEYLQVAELLRELRVAPAT